MALRYTTPDYVVTFKTSIAKESWKGIRDFLIDLPKNTKGLYRIQIEYALLHELGLSKYVGVDLNLVVFARKIGEDVTLDQAKKKMKSKLFKVLQKQLEKNGPTFALDVDKLSESAETATLIPKILELREKEMQSARILKITQSQYDLLPLWSTAYGYGILLALKAERIVGKSVVESARHELIEAGYDFEITNSKAIAFENIPKMSRAFQQYFEWSIKPKLDYTDHHPTPAVLAKIPDTLRSTLAESTNSTSRKKSILISSNSLANRFILQTWGIRPSQRRRYKNLFSAVRKQCRNIFSHYLARGRVEWSEGGNNYLYGVYKFDEIRGNLILGFVVVPPQTAWTLPT